MYYAVRMNAELYHVVFAVVYLIRGIVAVEKFAIICVVSTGYIHWTAIGGLNLRANPYVRIFRKWIGCI